MIRHVVLFRFAADHDPAPRAEWEAALPSLVGAVPGLRALSHGPDLVHAGRSWDHALVADFDSLDDVAAYAEHPAHLPVIALSARFSDEIVSVDFAVDDAGRPTADGALRTGAAA